MENQHFAVGQLLGDNLVVVHQDTLKLLQEQADAKNDLRAELRSQDEAVKERDKVFVEVDSHLGAIIHRYSGQLPDLFVQDIKKTLEKVQKYSR